MANKMKTLEKEKLFYYFVEYEEENVKKEEGYVIKEHRVV